MYVTSKREGVGKDGMGASMASDVLPFLIEQLDLLPPSTTKLDFLIVSFGGDPMVAWRIVSLIRERVDEFAVLLPQSAYSAATLVALGANEIVMHPNSHLGPVDMQITTFTEGRRRQFSTEDIGAFLKFVKDSLGITDQKHLRRLFEITCREVGSLGVGFTARSSQLAIALGERLLSLHMTDDKAGDAKTTRTSLIENLSRQFHSHDYPVSRSEALRIEGLPVTKERDHTLESLMWTLWLDLEEELQERKPFSPIIELLSGTQATKLLSPIPQLNLPLNAAGPTNLSASIPDVVGTSASATVEIAPIDFEHVDAVMESARLAHRGVTRGKIIASRMPDLDIKFNPVHNFRGWEKQT